ncbi:MAG: DNA-directed RNA polymerase subunit alpha [Candidatus Bipolaricaulota bacterium]
MDEMVFPKDVKVAELTETSGRIVLEPLEAGFGTTLGNALRRTLLTAIPGAAIVRVRFAGKYHEYDTIEGVKEDILEILLNLKGIALRVHEEGVKRLTLEKRGPGTVTAADVELPPGVEVVNPEVHIATLNPKAVLDLELEVETGFSYLPAEQNRPEDAPLSVIPIDADFSPVRKVNFAVEETRVGGKTGYERLILDVVTNGSIRPEEAVSEASRLLLRHLELFRGFAEHPFGMSIEETAGGGESHELSIPLVDLEIDQRACNLLQEADITTLGQLLARPREELLDIHGFGAKTLTKVEERLAELGYALRNEGEIHHAA